MCLSSNGSPNKPFDYRVVSGICDVLSYKRKPYGEGCNKLSVFEHVCMFFVCNMLLAKLNKTYIYKNKVRSDLIRFAAISKSAQQHCIKNR